MLSNEYTSSFEIVQSFIQIQKLGIKEARNWPLAGPSFNLGSFSLR